MDRGCGLTLVALVFVGPLAHRTGAKDVNVDQEKFRGVAHSIGPISSNAGISTFQMRRGEVFAILVSANITNDFRAKTMFA